MTQPLNAVDRSIADLADEVLDLLDRALSRYGELRCRLGLDEIPEVEDASTSTDTSPVVALVQTLEGAVRRRKGPKS